MTRPTSARWWPSSWPPWPTTKGALDTSRAHALIDEACRLDPATRQWHQEITEAAAPVVAEAALFAEAVWDWQRPA